MSKRRIILFLALGLLFCQQVWAESCEVHDFMYREEAPGCVSLGYSWYECTICSYSEGYASIEALGHDMTQWTVITEPSCKQTGLEQSVCQRCEAVQHREIGKADHDYAAEVIDPTCSADGYTEYVCSICQDSYRADRTEKLGHEFGEGVLTKEPTLTAMGRMTYTCIRCDESYTDTTPKWVNPFLDLDKKAFYFDSVLWAYNNGITSGTSSQSFGPEGSCTRAQVVTFLWRQAGKPEASELGGQFSDVSEDAFYFDAVCWAVEQGITKGVSSTEFAPDKVCTRCEVVTFLHRAKGSLMVDPKDSFFDVTPEDYFYNAVYWAYDRSITQGVEAWMFGPHQTCTRAQIVTFLYRARDL